MLILIIISILLFKQLFPVQNNKFNILLLCDLEEIIKHFVDFLWFQFYFY